MRSTMLRRGARDACRGEAGNRALAADGSRFGRAWRKLLLCVAVAALLLEPSAAVAQGHREVDIFSTAKGGGALTLDLGPGGPLIPVFESLCAGGECLYTAVDLGLVSPDVDVPEESLFALDTGARVSLEIVAIDAAVSIKLGQQLADTPGDVLDLGIAPGIHVHPEWQVLAPEGVEADFPLSVRLRAASPSPYAASEVIDLLLSNRRGPPPVETVPAIAELELEGPRARGDQLVAYYDTRDGFTAFLNVANQGESSLSVQLRFYGPLLDAPFDQVVNLAARGSRTLDLATLRSAGLPAQAGVVFATAVNDAGRTVTSGALAGSFTVANLATLSAWGGPAPARSAFRLEGATPVRPPAGTPIDGSTVVLEQLAPRSAELAVYYDPATLEPPSAGGNQVIAAAFADVVASQFAAVARSATWTVVASRNDGTPFPPASRSLSGVQVLDLASLIGQDVDGSAGHLALVLESASAPNRIVFFQESLGTFATGYRLPAMPEAGTPRAMRGVHEPAARGDQLVLYYDARAGFTTFLNIANQSDTELEARLQLYGAEIGEPLVTGVSLPARGTRTIDVAALRSQGLAAEAGIALVDVVGTAGAPVATRALAGSFTVANLGTRSAWGAPAAARTAVRQDGGLFAPVALGTLIDGDQVVFDQISPRILDLSVYYDPDTLEPAALGGNQLVFISFDDVAGDARTITRGEVAWGFAGTRSNGETTAAGTYTTRGVVVSDLESVTGVDLGGAAGRLRFSIRPPGAANRIIYFAESLGTFATGYALPAEE